MNIFTDFKIALSTTISCARPRNFDQLAANTDIAISGNVYYVNVYIYSIEFLLLHV